MTARAAELLLLVALALSAGPAAAGVCVGTPTGPGEATSRCSDGRECRARTTPAGIESACSDGTTSLARWDPARRAFVLDVRDARGALRERCVLAAGSCVPVAIE